MTRQYRRIFTGALGTLAVLFCSIIPAQAGPGGGTYYANSPAGGATGTALRKFVDGLPGLGADNANNLGQYIPVAVPDKTSYPGSDYYEIGLTEYTERMHSDLPATGTLLRGYYQINTSDPAVSAPHYLGPLIVAERNRPVRVKFVNQLPPNSNLFLPVDTTIMGAGLGPKGVVGGNYSENRATLHLHGGYTPWISDGTPHQWITPAGETTPYLKGVSVKNVPDMAAPGSGAQTFYYPNQQSGRLMFYHDHAYGLTRLNVYAGEAAGYLLQDPVEQGLIDSKIIPPNQVPLIIQDKTFVPANIAVQDALWDTTNWGQPGDLWLPHVYEPNQTDPTLGGIGMNPKGRWDYGPWLWPPAVATYSTLPQPSIAPEAFMDTPVINGTAYPYLNVEPRRYRFRVLNAANDRTFNLQLYYASDAKGNVCNPAIPPVAPPLGACKEVAMVIPAPDGRPGGIPDPDKAGPPFIQIGNEGGLLPAPAVLNNPPLPISYDLDRRSATFGNVNQYNLLLGTAERADIIIDFSKVPVGSKLILYNDSPSPSPMFDPRYDYYTGNPDQTAIGGAPSTKPGYGPNTRTIMQFRVVARTGSADPYNFTTNLAALKTALPNAFAASQPPPLVPLCDPEVPNTCGNITLKAGSRFGGFPVLFKSISEDFDVAYGRMNARLGTGQFSLNTQGVQTFGKDYIQKPTEVIPEGRTQIWMVAHNGIDTHTIHFHLVNVQVINRIDAAGIVKPPDPNELGWKETVRMNPLENVVLAIKPTTPTVPFNLPASIRALDVTMPASKMNPLYNLGFEYVWHCHLLGHEENDMMRPLLVANAISVYLPAAPTSLVANRVSGPKVNLTWKDNATNEKGFRIERAAGTGAFSAVATVGPNVTSYSDSGVSAATTYRYRVIAFNVSGDSPPSNTATVTIP